MGASNGWPRLWEVRNAILSSNSQPLGVLEIRFELENANDSASFVLVCFPGNSLVKENSFTWCSRRKQRHYEIGPELLDYMANIWSLSDLWVLSDLRHCTALSDFVYGNSTTVEWLNCI
ncbi:hypothetical protein GH714_040686 [Hevea brasiliensis]|uniref:Uncharacterized protein n=1 Tax=Hevea brasiliensis TaxID=3981 RepID=A0A6A6MQ35_HEVBR|nr:hypothetical protein GH714_040686 [Hevea brasiliensis]